MLQTRPRIRSRHARLGSRELRYWRRGEDIRLRWNYQIFARCRSYRDIFAGFHHKTIFTTVEKIVDSLGVTQPLGSIYHGYPKAQANPWRISEYLTSPTSQPRDLGVNTRAIRLSLQPKASRKRSSRNSTRILRIRTLNAYQSLMRTSEISGSGATFRISIDAS